MKKLILALGIATLVAGPAVANDLTEEPTLFVDEPTLFAEDPELFTGEVNMFTDGEVVEVALLTSEEGTDLYDSPDLERVETRLPRTERVIGKRHNQVYEHYDENSIYHNQMFDDTDAVNNRIIRGIAVVKGGKGDRYVETRNGRTVSKARTIRGYTFGGEK